MLCARRAGMLVITRGEACKCKCKCKMQMSPVDKENPPCVHVAHQRSRYPPYTRVLDNKKHYACLRFVESAVSLAALPCPAIDRRE